MPASGAHLLARDVLFAWAAPPHGYKQHSDEHTLGAATSSTSGALPGLAPMSIMDVMRLASRRGNEAGMSELRGHAGALHRHAGSSRATELCHRRFGRDVFPILYTWCIRGVCAGSRLAWWPISNLRFRQTPAVLEAIPSKRSREREVSSDSTQRSAQKFVMPRCDTED